MTEKKGVAQPITLEEKEQLKEEIIKEENDKLKADALAKDEEKKQQEEKEKESAKKQIEEDRAKVIDALKVKAENDLKTQAELYEKRLAEKDKIINQLIEGDGEIAENSIIEKINSKRDLQKRY